MSQQKPTKRSAAPPPVSVPGVISAIVVLVVLGLLGVLLFNRANSQGMAQDAADEPTAVAEAAPDTDTESGADSNPTAVSVQQGAYTTPPPMTIDPETNYTATITTPRGDIVIRLLPDIAPQSVNNFVFLAREGFYDGLTWHRVMENFMAQGGDPEGTGTGGPGYTIPDEFTNEILFDRPGLVAMARPNAPDSAGSQFFITTAPAPWLNEQYTIFGEVTEGQAIVDAIPLRDPATATASGEEIITITITEE